MPDRTYGQYCGVARALDLVGERWALLIIRELSLGGKRFTDLKEGLPGIGTNVLATRLRQLGADGIVAKLRLLPPADTTVYVLTEYGERLVPSLLSLGRWGAETMGDPQPSQTLRSGWLAVALRAFFQPEAARRVRATIELNLSDGPFRVDLDRGKLTVSQGPAPGADLRLTADDITLLGFLRGVGVEPVAEGDRELLRQLPEIFAFT
jgi:DNA-binding HxlR family transcriptional regulator